MSAAAGAKTSTRPNILLVTTDQQRGDCLGIEHAAGAPHPVMTPHLDQLAYEGIRFTRGYSDCPVCIPARTTIMTGRTARTNGMVSNSTDPIPETPHRTLPGRLAAAGYQTHAAGKMHFNPPRRRNGFERMRLLPEDYVNWLERTPYPGGYRAHGLGGNEVTAAFNPLPVEYTATHWIVDESIDFLRQRDPDYPFFMWTSFEAPHPPFEPPEQFVRLSDGVEIPPPVIGDWAAAPLPAAEGDSGADGGAVPRPLQQRRWTHKLDHLTPGQIRAARRHYYAQITHVDYELGRLFGELQSQRLWDDTVVIFTSDHGEMLGDHGAFHKQLFYEPSARVPYLLRVPHRFDPPAPAGTTVSTPALLADLYPTCLDLARLWTAEDAAERDGQSLMTAPWTRGERWVFGQCGGGRNASYMATDGRQKYVYYPWGGTEQLFDLERDPAECHDLAQQATHAALLDACRARLGTAFPELLAAAPTGHPFRVIDEPLPDAARARAANPYAWRGPIRYGGHW
jgi:arylsulfatase A-like enzyme